MFRRMLTAIRELVRASPSADAASGDADPTTTTAPSTRRAISGDQHDRWLERNQIGLFRPRDPSQPELASDYVPDWAKPL